MENTDNKRERILRSIINCLGLLYNPKPHSGTVEFDELKKEYFSLKKEWFDLHKIENELFGPFNLNEDSFEKIRASYELNFLILRDDITKEPGYHMLSGLVCFNLAQRKRKNNILRLALDSQGISFDKLFPSKFRDMKNCILQKLNL